MPRFDKSYVVFVTYENISNPLYLFSKRTGRYQYVLQVYDHKYLSQIFDYKKSQIYIADMG